MLNLAPNNGGPYPPFVASFALDEQFVGFVIFMKS